MVQFIVVSYRYVAITSSYKAALVLAQSILNTRLLDQCLLMEDSLSDTFKFRYYSKKNSILFHRYWSCIDSRMPESILLQYRRKSIKYSFEYSIDTSEPIPNKVSISFRRFFYWLRYRLSFRYLLSLQATREFKEISPWYLSADISDSIEYWSSKENYVSNKSNN